MDLFEEISKTKSDFPKIKSIKKEFSGKKLNLYQIFSIGLFVVFFFLGIIFGNLFSTCKASSYYFSDTCFENCSSAIFFIRKYNFAYRDICCSF